MKTACIQILLLITLLTPIKSFSQSIGSSYNEQTRNLLIYNVGTTAVISGVGAIITREDKNKTKWYNAFLKGFMYGAVGGYCMYEAKNVVYNVTAKENLAYYWPAKLLFGAGEAISENAAANRKPWQRWHVNLWLSRVDIDFQEKVQVGIMPDLIQTYGFVREFVLGRHFNFALSGQTGLLVFDAKNLKDRHGNYDGYAIPGALVINNTSIDTSYYSASLRNHYKHQVYAHEMIHTFQFYNYPSFRGYFGNSSKELKGVKEDYSAIWSFIQPLLFYGLYYTVGGGVYSPEQYYRNFYEFEAEHFATKQRVDIR